MNREPHPTAAIDEGARLAAGVGVGPCAVIEAGVRVGPGCRIHAHAVLRAGTVLEANVEVHPHAVLGGEPQDLRFDRDTPSGVHIGAGTIIREHVTINRATATGANTTVGANCFLLAACHLPHDASVGDGTVIANAALFGGHVSIGAHCFIGGSAVFHQGVRIGDGVMASGNGAFTRDIAPYLLVSGRDRVNGLNRVGLKRQGYPAAAVGELKELFRAVLDTPGNPRELAAALTAETELGRRFLAFFAGGTRGFLTRRAGRNPDEVPDA
jgi:UDP-N-acetylglucosamine acyltransferase